MLWQQVRGYEGLYGRALSKQWRGVKGGVEVWKMEIIEMKRVGRVEGE